MIRICPGGRTKIVRQALRLDTLITNIPWEKASIKPDKFNMYVLFSKPKII